MSDWKCTIKHLHMKEVFGGNAQDELSVEGGVGADSLPQV